MNSIDDQQQAIAITAIEGIFPNAENTDILWERILHAEVAPLEDLSTQWGVDTSKLIGPFPGDGHSTYMTRAHCLDGHALDLAECRQESAGKLVFDRITKHYNDLSTTGAVFGTSSSSDNYFSDDLEQSLGNVKKSPSVQDPSDQLFRITGNQLGGPVLAVDTACASSLYALETAINTLQTNRAKRMLVIGLNATLPLFLFTGFSKLCALSQQEKLNAYLESADGIVLGEAVAAICVEPLSQALEEKREVLAIVGATSLSADGADRSVFAPGIEGQHYLYSRAYSALGANYIDYLEGHGTATNLGDETELHAIKNFFGSSFSEDKPLPIGSVKSLTGHTLAAAGLISIIKGVLMIKNKTLPPHIKGNCNQIIENSSITLLDTSKPWVKEGNDNRRMGISSLGFGGANAHVILEEYSPTNTVNQSSFTQASSKEIAIVGISGQIGSYASLGCFSDTNSAKEECRFPAHLKIEAKGLRMGPKFLERIDPLQLLITHHVHQLLPSQLDTQSRARTGTVCVNNLGGNLSLKTSRRLACHYFPQQYPTYSEDLDKVGPEPTLESIASSLPGLISGYPAFHFDFKGFHETISGFRGTFWETLALTSNWLEQKANELYLCAATSVKSPLDNLEKKHGEAAIAIHLKPVETLGVQEKPIAIIKHIIWNVDHKQDVESLLEQENLTLNNIEHHVVCNLSIENHQRSKWQERAEDLFEIQGIETLIGMLFEEYTGLCLLEIREKDSPKTALVFNKIMAARDRDTNYSYPFNLAFDPFYSDSQEIQQDNNLSILRELKEDLPIEVIIDVVEYQKKAMLSFFKHQQELSDILSNGTVSELVCNTVEPSSHNYVYDRKNTVSNNIQLCDSRRATSTLIVDVNHPYFFDHPLDHVPGILLLAGVQQTVESICQDNGNNKGKTPYLRYAKFRFKRFCEKDKEVSIELDFVDSSLSTSHIRGAITQNAEPLCDIMLITGIYDEPISVDDYSIDSAPPNKKWLHKHLTENVLVTALFEMDGKPHTNAIMPPKGHYFSSGHPTFLSLLYILEVCRQFIMLYAHILKDVPLGKPINLISISVDMERPAIRNQQLTLSLDETKINIIDANDMHLAETIIELHDVSGKIGECSLVSQIVDPELYQKQRAK